MSEEQNKREGRTENEPLNKADELIEKGKEFADKAEDFFTEKVKKLRNSDAFGKFADALGKVEEIMENKSQEFHNGEMGAKFEAFKEKTEGQASNFWNKAKEAGRKIGDQVDESIDSIKGKKNQSNNQDGSGI